MKIQLQHNRQNYPLNNRKNENSKGTTSFKGFSAAMNFFATNQGVGACCTDLGFVQGFMMNYKNINLRMLQYLYLWIL